MTHLAVVIDRTVIELTGSVLMRLLWLAMIYYNDKLIFAAAAAAAINST